MSSMFPNQVTELGARVDTVQFFLIAVMAFWFVACNAVMVYMLLKYRRTSDTQETSTVKGHHLLEMAWTIIPTIMVGIIFYFGINVWTDMRQPPEDAMEIRVQGQKWSWSFTYVDGPESLQGRNTAEDLYVPQGQPIKLTMKSADVLHSFFVPEFRIKEDVVPSLFTTLWFKADKAGEYNIFCTEYCGDNHSQMFGKVHVLDPETWLRFVNKEPLDPNDRPKTPLELGEELYVKRACKGCHSTDGLAIIGPSFKGLYGKTESVMINGVESQVTVDDNYIMESIKQPEAKLVTGYPAKTMPAYEGQLTDEDIANLITYIKTLK